MPDHPALLRAALAFLRLPANAPELQLLHAWLDNWQGIGLIVVGMTRQGLPRYIPMIPTQVREPFHRDGWVYEEKVDGWRILVYKDDGCVRLLSRTGVDHAKRFRDVAAAIAALKPATLVLDGELAIFDEHLRSRFDWLRRGADADALATLPVYIAFDGLYRAGKDETDRPLRDRRVLLEDVISTSAIVLPARRLAANGLDAWAQVLGKGYEGYVVKDDLSPYRGGVTRSWLKVKVPGWTDPEDRWKRVRLGGTS